MTGRSLGVTTEKDCPVRSSSVISTGAELPFMRDTGVLAAWPIDTASKVTVSGDAVRTPAPAPFTTILPPQPDKAKGRQQNQMMSRAAHQPLRRQL